MKLKDLTGQIFGRLTVVERAPAEPGKTVQWLVRCECGNALNVYRGNLLRGRTNSCGCLNKEAVGNRRRSHGASHTRTYKSWLMAKRRCLSTDAEDYQHYGGRGITMCQRWLDSFENFLADMGERPEGLTLERKEINGNYEPGNCEWANRTKQALNQRARRQYLFDGVWLNLSQLQKRLNTSRWLAKKKTINLPYRYVGTGTTQEPL